MGNNVTCTINFPKGDEIIVDIGTFFGFEYEFQALVIYS
jgi:hypothetical protein